MTSAEIEAISNAVKENRFVSIGDIQKAPGKHLADEFRVITSNGKPRGYYIPESELEEIKEDWLAENSPKYLKAIEDSRNDTELFSLEDVIKDHNLDIKVS